MSSQVYQVLDAIADSVNPILTVIALGIIVVEWRRREPAKALAFAIATALGLGCIYAIAAMDQRWQLWRQFGGDYSLHSAYAASVGTSLLLRRRAWIVPVVACLVGYLAMIVFMGYHRTIDVVAAGLLGAVLTLPWHLAAR